MSAVLQTLQYIYKTKSHMFPTSVSWKEGEFLSKVVSRCRPKNLIEVGLGYGITTLWIYTNRYKPKKHTIVDPHLRDLKDVVHLVKYSGAPNAIFVNTTSQKYFAKIPAKSIDMIMHDGDNHFDAYMTDLYFAVSILKVGGFFFTRNMWNPPVYKSILFAMRNLPFSLVDHSLINEIIYKTPSFISEKVLRMFSKFTQEGYCLLQKTDEDNRTWNSFREF